MATFLIKSQKTITRQAGDDCDVVFTVPDIMPLTSASDYQFIVTGNAVSKPVILNKTLPAITITGQQITVPIMGSETASEDGDFKWALRLRFDGAMITIGSGTFKLLKQ